MTSIGGHPDGHRQGHERARVTAADIRVVDANYGRRRRARTWPSRPRSTRTRITSPPCARRSANNPAYSAALAAHKDKPVANDVIAVDIQDGGDVLVYFRKSRSQEPLVGSGPGRTSAGPERPQKPESAEPKSADAERARVAQCQEPDAKQPRQSRRQAVALLGSRAVGQFAPLGSRASWQLRLVRSSTVPCCQTRPRPARCGPRHRLPATPVTHGARTPAARCAPRAGS